MMVTEVGQIERYGLEAYSLEGPALGRGAGALNAAFALLALSVVEARS